MFSSPIFIVGAGRSGTTLMRSLLAAHSRLVVTPETQFLVKAAAFGGLEQRDARRCEAFWQTYIADPRFVDLEVDPYRCRELAAAAASYEGIAALLVGTLEAYRERHGKPRVGEKTPDHVWFVSSLLATFPDARVLVMQRDPRAVVASHMRMWWTNYHPPSLKNGLVRHTRLQRMVARALEWMKLYGTLLPQFRDNERVCIIKYEELVSDPKFTLHRICEFVDEPFEPEMVTHRSASTVPDFAVLEKLDPSMRQWAREHHDRSLQPIDEAAVESWRTELRPAEVAMIEGCCAAAMEEAGYTITSTPMRRRTLNAFAQAVPHAVWLESRIRRIAKRVESRLLNVTDVL